MTPWFVGFFALVWALDIYCLGSQYANVIWRYGQNQAGNLS